MTTAWFINEDGDVYDYDIERQEMDFPGDDHTPFESEAVARAAAEALDDTRPPVESVTIEEALNYAIFAINTFVEPSASSAEDMARLDEHADAAIEMLVHLRDINRDMQVT